MPQGTDEAGRSHSLRSNRLDVALVLPGHINKQREKPVKSRLWEAFNESNKTNKNKNIISDM